MKIYLLFIFYQLVSSTIDSNQQKKLLHNLNTNSQYKFLETGKLLQLKLLKQQENSTTQYQLKNHQEQNRKLVSIIKNYNPISNKKQNQFRQKLRYLNDEPQQNLIQLKDISDFQKQIKNIQKILESPFQLLQVQNSKKERSIQNLIDLEVDKLKNFQKQLVNSSEKLMTILNNYEKKVQLMQEDQEHMIQFFQFSNLYYTLKDMSMSFADSRLEELWDQIDNFTDDYNLSIEQIKQNSSDLYIEIKQLAEQIQIVKVFLNKPRTQLVQKSDEIIKYNVLFLEQKKLIENTNNQLLKSFDNLEIIYYYVQSELDKLQEIYKIYSKQKGVVQDQQSGIKIEEKSQQYSFIKQFNIVFLLCNIFIYANQSYKKYIF